MPNTIRSGGCEPVELAFCPAATTAVAQAKKKGQLSSELRREKRREEMAGRSGGGGWCGTDALNERRSQRSAATGGVVTEMDAIRLAERMEMDGDVHTVLRRQHVTTHVRDDTTESERTARKSGVRRVTTRVVRQTTTITRGEQRALTENVNRLDGHGAQPYQQHHHHPYQQQHYSSYASERDASLYEERVPVPAITYRVTPERSFKRSKVNP